MGSRKTVADFFFPPGHKIYFVRNLAFKNAGLSARFGNNPTDHLLRVSLFSENAVAKFSLQVQSLVVTVSKQGSTLTQARGQ